MKARLALAELRAHPSRAAAVVLAIMISVGFIAASLTFVATEQRAIGRAATAQTAGADVVVEQNSDRSMASMLASIRRVPGVRAVEPTFTTYTTYSTATGSGELQLESVSTDPGLRYGTLTSGHWPTSASEVVLDRTSARHSGLTVGSTFSVPQLHATGTTAQTTLTVVGISTAGRSLLGSTSDTGYAATGFFTGTESPYSSSEFMVDAVDGVSPSVLADRLQSTLKDAATAQTADQHSAEAIHDLTRGADVFRIILLVFGAVAVLVGSIIVVNTFTILLVQRRRQIGLLRVVGADARQVRSSVLIEALLLGVVGSVLGTALGLALAATGSLITGSIASGLAVPWRSLIITALGGTVITVLAAAVPARRALRVTPLDALRPVADQVQARQGSRVRVIIATVALVIGSGLIGAGLLTDASQLISSAPLVLSVGGSFLAALGLVIMSPTLVPVVLRGVRMITSRFGPVPRLAAANSIRNPGRASATCVALMLGVGLIVTLQVGAASTKATVLSEIRQRFPVDLTVRADQGAVPSSVNAAIAQLSGVSAAVPVATTGVSLDGHRDMGSLVLQGPGPDAAAATSGQFDRVDDATLLVSRFTAKELNLTPGQQVTIRHGSRHATLTVGMSDLADDATLLTSREELFALDPSAALGALWVSVPDVDRASDVMAQVRKIIGEQPLTLGGSLDQTADYVTLLDTLLTVATALLGVAVLIALIGVGNTLGLSVLERTRESALLRALGLQRRQLRGMLAVEAVSLALVGAVIGIAAGIAFGWIGTLALAKQLGLGETIFSISGPQTAAVVGVAVLAGALASVLPARRAARATPTEALADV